MSGFSSMGKHWKAAVLLAGVAAGLGVAPGVQAQGTPRYLFSQSNTISGYGLVQGNMATDKFGNLFVPDLYVSRVVETPANGGANVTVFTDQTGALMGGVATDPAGNLYVTLVYHTPTATDSSVYKLPATSNGIAPYVFTGAAPATCTATSTTACTYGNFFQPAGYYYQGQTISFDGAGVGYYVTLFDSLDGGGKDIFRCDASCAVNAANATVVVGKLPTKVLSLAAAPNGDLYWSDGLDVYYAKAGSSAFSVFDTSFEAGGGAKGVGFDRAGNLYVSAATGTFEYPAVNAVLTTGSKFLVVGAQATSGAAVGNNGEVYSQPYYGVVTRTALDTANVGTAAVGQAAAGAMLTVSFLSPGTVASVAVAGSSGSTKEFSIVSDTCTGTTQGVNGTCTVNVGFTPAAVGVRRGTVVLTDTAGNTAVSYLSGVGTGTGVAVDPGTPATISTALLQPSGIAVDSAQNVYVADSKAGTVTLFASGAAAGTTIASGLKTPSGVALDGAGNLLVVEQAGNDVLEYARTATGLASAPTVLVAGLNGPTDVAVSGAGIVYVSNTGANEVRQYPNPARLPSSMQSSSYGTALKAPTGLALDSTGNLFIADTGNNQVVQITRNGVQSVLGSGLSAPTGVAAEASGSVLIADQGNGRVVRVPFEAAGLTTGDQVTVPQPVVNPYALRLASDGTLFVTDNLASQVASLLRTNGTVDFGITNAGTTSAARSILVSSTGTDTLALGSPFFGTPPLSSNFTLTAGTVGKACAPGALAAGTSCSLSALFSPSANGTQTFPVALNASAANTATPGVILTGRGVQLVAVGVTVSANPAGAVTYGTTVALTAKVTAAAASTATPTGSVVFTVDGNASKAVALVSGQAGFTLAGLGSGSHTVVVSYAGDGTFASGVSAPISVQVNPASTTGVLTITGTGTAPLSAASTDVVSFALAITPAVAGSLSGSVTFYNGTAVLGTAPVFQTSTAGVGQYGATFSFSPTAATPTAPGVYQVSAVFMPASNYAGFTTASQTLTIVASPTYGIVADASTLTATASSYGTANLLVSSYAGFQAGVSLTCGNLPANAYCVFRPGIVSLTSNGTGVPQQTTQMQVRVSQDPVNILSASGFGLLGGITGIGLLVAMRQRRSVAQLAGCGVSLTIACFAVSLVTGCGSTATSASAYPTPAGTYTFVLHSTASPLIGGQAPVPFSVARVQVTAGTSSTGAVANVGHIITTTANYFPVGTVLQLTGNSVAAFNTTLTVTGQSTVTDPKDAYLGSSQLDFAVGATAAGTTGTGGTLRQPNVALPDQTFMLVVQ